MPQSKLWYNRSKRILSQVMLWKWAPKSTMFLKKIFFSCSRGISSFLTRDRICSSHPPVLGAQSQPTGPPGHPCFLILSVSTRLPRTCQSSWLWACWDCPGLWGKMWFNLMLGSLQAQAVSKPAVSTYSESCKLEDGYRTAPIPRYILVLFLSLSKMYCSSLIRH